MLQKFKRLSAFQVVQRTAAQALQMEMLRTVAVLAGGLIIAHRCARACIRSVKTLQHTLAAQRAKLAVQRTFGDRLAVYRGEENLTQRIDRKLPIRVLRKVAQKLVARPRLIRIFCHVGSFFEFENSSQIIAHPPPFVKGKQKISSIYKYLFAVTCSSQKNHVKKQEK